jgi:hypothetical protein
MRAHHHQLARLGVRHVTESGRGVAPQHARLDRRRQLGRHRLELLLGVALELVLKLWLCE